MNAVDELNALLGIGPPKPKLPITLQRSGYEPIKVLGKGSFGQAYLIYHKSTQKYFVAKHINLSQMNSKQRKEAHNEIAILQRMKHPNVVRYEESVEETPNLYIVMEYADGGDLYSHINKVKASGAMLTEDQVMNLFTQVAMAIKYMHDRRVIHRDIKPQNVFLTKSKVVKLGDFGISTVLNHTMAMAKTMCGTPCYFSPELCIAKPYNNKSDVWALGVMLYEMASLELPFDSPNMKRLMEDIVRVQPARKRSFSDGMWDLIKKMLEKDPMKRPDMDGVLSHPTVTKAMPRIAQLLSDTSNGAPDPTDGMGTGSDANMMALWKAKRDREAAAADAKVKAPTANNLIPAPPQPILTGAPTPAPRSNVPILQKPPPPINNVYHASPGQPMAAPSASAQPVVSAASIERAKREEEYRKLREELDRVEENRRLRMERDRQQEGVLEEQLKRREEHNKQQVALEQAEAEVRRAEALRILKEKEAKEAQAAVDARKAKATAEQHRELEAARAAVEAKEAKDKADELAKRQAVMLADSPSKSVQPSNNKYEDDFEVEEEQGLKAVIRNMNSIHLRSLHLKEDDGIEDEVGHVEADRKPNTDLNMTIVDEVPNHTFEDPMGTRVNVEEMQLASPTKLSRNATPSNNKTSGEQTNNVSMPSASSAANESDDPFQGGCLCGKVEFSGWISYIYGSFTCQCNLCKRFTGSTLGVSWLHLPAVLFPEVAKPSDALRYFALGTEKTQCYFCRKCGSSLAMEHPGIDGCVISKAALDEKSIESLNKMQRTAR